MTFIVPWISLGACVIILIHMISLILPEWGTVDNLLIPNSSLHYGLFQVCGYGGGYSSAFSSIASDCVAYDSSDLPVQLFRTNHLSSVFGCRTCDDRRRSSAAFSILAILANAIAILQFGKLNATLGNVLVFIGVICGCISMSIWVNMVLNLYNKDHRWIELANGYEEPRMKFQLSLFLCASAWVLNIFVLFLSHDSIMSSSSTSRFSEASSRAQQPSDVELNTKEELNLGVDEDEKDDESSTDSFASVPEEVEIAEREMKMAETTVDSSPVEMFTSPEQQKQLATTSSSLPSSPLVRRLLPPITVPSQLPQAEPSNDINDNDAPPSYESATTESHV
eukprot:m.19516 g.19516  ORF g.19516 m.19516 type:complete len:337 (+) comp5128_c0_seq2:120-1130(+)